MHLPDRQLNLLVKSAAVLLGMAAVAVALTIVPSPHSSSLHSPMVTKIVPPFGASAGTTVVTISGKNFTRSARVDFGTTPATNLTFVSAKMLEVTAPFDPGGTVDVVVLTQYGESPVVPDRTTFTYVPLPP